MTEKVKRNHSEGLPAPDPQENTVKYNSTQIRAGYKDWAGGKVLVKCLKTAPWSVAPYKTRQVQKDEIVTLTDRRVIDLLERENLGVVVDEQGRPIKKQKKAAAENKSL